VAFQSFVVLVFIWLGDGSRLNKSCLHDLGVPYHHCYRVSSPLLVEFISVNFFYKPYVCFNHMVMLSFDLLITVHLSFDLLITVHQFSNVLIIAWKRKIQNGLTIGHLLLS
jgi:hypothetical protein